MAKKKNLRKFKSQMRIDRFFRGQLISQAGRVMHYTPAGNRIKKKAELNPEKETVLLMQGYVQTRGVLNMLEGRLRRDGYEVASFHLGGFLNTYNTVSIERLASHVKRKIARLRARHQLPRIHMIGHSKGGLVGRYLVQLLGGEEHVKTLIMLGSPNRGTPTAVLAAVPPLSLITGGSREMLPGSKLVKKLNSAPFTAQTKFVNICSRTDVVCPYPYSWLEPSSNGNVHNLMVHGPGHTNLLISERVYRLIRGELQPDFVLDGEGS